MISTFQHLSLLALLSIGTSCFAQVYTPTVTVDSLPIAIKEDTTKVQRLEEAQFHLFVTQLFYLSSNYYYEGF